MAAQISGTGAVGLINQMTVTNTTSGTSVSYTGIPTGVKRITVMLNGVSTNGTADLLIQVGSGSTTTTGYDAYYVIITTSSTTAGGTASNGFQVNLNGATNSNTGHLVLTNITGNTWVASGMAKKSSAASSIVTGSIALSGALDRVIITTTTGTDTFDAGSVNVLYE